MITLYALPTCPFCKKVRDVLNELELEFTELDVNEPEHREKLIELGGKKTVPYLIDSEKNVQMYESDDIIEFLKSTYKK